MGLVKFSHTIFAMPFALMAFVFALKTTDAQFSWILLLQVVGCMVFARNVAMGFNRWADHKIDGENPRTATREIPAGKISPKSAMTFVVINALLFIAVSSSINLLTAVLSHVALIVVMFYSYCKRFTSLAHLVLGLSLGIAPAAAYIAVTGTLTFAPCLISLLVLTWCGGFDIIYALQDLEFDRQRGLHSIPVRFGVRGALYISITLHAASIISLILFAGIVSAFVDNVATVLMIAPVALAFCKKVGVSPVSSIICIAISSNLQGAATLVGDTTSILLAKAAGLDFSSFFVDEGKVGMFWVVQAGALVSALIILFMFRKERNPIEFEGKTKVEDYVPTILLVGTVVALIAVSFIPYKDAAAPALSTNPTSPTVSSVLHFS